MIDLQGTLRLHGLWLAGEPGGAHADLTGANLRRADLRRADLRGADLRRADLTGANLRHADLRGADLRRADLTDADLGGANLTDADLTGANLRRADLRGADLRRADLTGADLRDANLRGADLTGANLTDADLRDADLRRADLTDADLGGANLGGANLGDAVAALACIPNLHIKTLDSIERGGVLEMRSWHLNSASCGTQHCRAGWYIHHAGAAGAMLEALWGPAAAGAIIAIASCPYLGRVPDFYCSNEVAMADIRRCAEIERGAETSDAHP